jgi:PST family polysaccharide transporter
MINPLSWLLLSSGLQGRSLAVALVIAPLVTSAYFIGLPYGPNGVALSYSTAMTLWLVPHIVWCLRGTPISPWDLFLAVRRSFVSGIVAAAAAFIVLLYVGPQGHPLVRLALGGCVMVSVYCYMLLLVMGQRAFYLDLLAVIRNPSLDRKTEY